MKAIRKPKETGYLKQHEPVVNHLHELDFSATYSYANYRKWQFEDRVELIRGKIFPMSAPTITHQRLLLRLAVMFDQITVTKPCCETFIAPFDVRLLSRETGENEVYTVLQPDLCVICDPSQLDEKGCVGRPDLIVEIMSADGLKKDLRIKHQLYAEVGVTEYLVIDPKRRVVYKHLLNTQGSYVQQVFTGKQECRSALFPALAFIPDELFAAQPMMSS